MPLPSRAMQLPAATFNQVATVYGRSEVTHDFTTVLAANLRCRLSDSGGGRTAQERAELAAQRILIWDSAVEIPAHAQIQIAGQRWAPLAESFAAPSVIDDSALYRRCQVTRVES